MRLFTFLLIVAALSAEPISTFEVKELAPAVSQKLNDAEAKLSSAMESLAAAQKAAEKAQQERDKAKVEALNSVGVLQVENMPCTATRYGQDLGAAFPIEYGRLFTRVEIRGKYALITSGIESCYPSITGTAFTTTNSNILLNHDTVWNGTTMLTAEPVAASR